MTDSALGDTALAQMCAGTDEAMFAGLLLLTKCSRATIAKLAPKTAEVLLGVVSSTKKSSSSNFLRRLLLTKPLETGDEADADTEARVPLSQMQALGLNVCSTLAQTGPPQVRSLLARSLASTVVDMLAVLVAQRAAATAELSATNDVDLALEEVLQCLRALFQEDGEYDKVGGQEGGSSSCLPPPPTLMTALVRLVRCYPKQACDDTAPDAFFTQKAEGNDVDYNQEEDAGNSDSSPDPAKSSLRVVSLTLGLMRHIVVTPPPRPSTRNDATLLWREWAGRAEAAASLAVVLPPSGLSTCGKKGGGGGGEGGGDGKDEKEGPGRKEEEEPSREMKAWLVGVALDLVLRWASAAIAAGALAPANLDEVDDLGLLDCGLVCAVPHEARTLLEAGPFASSLRRGLVVALHGGASEALRDKAIQTVSALFQVLGGGWAIESDPASSTLKGSTACLFLGVTATELRLLVDEALALFTTNSSSGGSSQEPTNGEEEKKSTASADGDASVDEETIAKNKHMHELRFARISRVVPVCLEVVEHTIKFLCEGDDDDEDDDGEEEGEGEKGKGGGLTLWATLPAPSLLAMQQTLIGIARTIVEFLQDARAAAMSKATDAAATDGGKGGRVGAPSSLSARAADVLASEGEGRAIRQLVLACGRCLSCWLSQDSSGGETLRKELADSNAFAFLLSLSSYSIGPMCSYTQSSNEHTSGGAVALEETQSISASGGGGGGQWGGDDDGALDSDDELVLPPPPTTATTQPLANLASRAPTASLEGGYGASGDDVMFHLLPALMSLCDGSDDGPVELAEVGVHVPVCTFVCRELASALLVMNTLEEATATMASTVMPLVWALDLLVQMLAEASAHILSEEEDEEGEHMYQGQLVDHPCFAKTKEAILLSCTRAQQAFRPTVGYQQPRSSHLDGADDGDGKNNDDFSSLGSQRRLALDHAVTLFLVIERYATYAPSGVTKGGGEEEAMVAAWIERADMDQRSASDPMVALARSLAASRR